MALTLEPTVPDALSLDEYVDRVTREVDLADPDAVAASADLLAGLAACPTLLTDELNRELAAGPAASGPADGYSAQTLVLARGPGFVVRANLWLPPAGGALEREAQRKLNAYEVPHDHDFSFLTVGYWGPGYTTTIWEYDPATIHGVPGEPVDLDFRERTTLPAGKVMLYRASRDVHSQEPPIELSVSLNLLLTQPDGPQAQYLFDPAGGCIAGIVPNAAESRTALCRLAGCFGDGTTVARLEDAVAADVAPRMRWAAFESLAALQPDEAPAIRARAAADPDPVVRALAAGAAPA